MSPAPLLGRMAGRRGAGGQSGRRLAGAAAVAAAAAVAVVLVAAAASGVRPSALLGLGQMLVVGEAYPYVRTPYADVARPYGYQSPVQYPVYPYESGYSYGNVEPYYTTMRKDQGKASHEWFPDDYNVGTGPLTPLWTAMGMKQRELQQAALRQQGMGPGLRTTSLLPAPREAHSALQSLSGYSLSREDHAPTTAVGGGQYYSPILPSENEYTPWSIFGDNWADHTYEPSVNTARRSNGASRLRKSVQSKLRAAAEPRLGDTAGFQELAHADWHTRGFSNNYMGMQAPVRNVNALGDHQVGFTDREYNASDVSAEEQNHVVDNALRSVWDVFSGNADVTQLEAPKMGYSLDQHILCDEEDDPALCNPRAYGARPVSEARTNPEWIPYPTNVQLNQGVLATDQRGADRGVLPAGGGVRTYKGRRGDLVKDCTDPASCHLKSAAFSTGPVLPVVPPYGLSHIPDGRNTGVDYQPLFTRPPPAPLPESNTTEPLWLRQLREASGYTGP